MEKFNSEYMYTPVHSYLEHSDFFRLSDKGISVVTYDISLGYQHLIHEENIQTGCCNSIWFLIKIKLERP